MRRFIAALCIAAPVIGLAGTAIAAEPVGTSGSTFTDKVRCGHTNTFIDSGALTVANYYDGLEVCSSALGSRAFIQSNYKKPIYLPSYVHADVLNTHVLHLPLPF